MNPIETRAATGRCEIICRHLEFARGYTKQLLQGLDEDQWFWVPQPAVSHIAWQVGHIAVAQYGLCLFRQRGRKEIDAELMSGQFRKLFGKGSMPADDRQAYPSSAEILAVGDRVFDQSMRELGSFEDDRLDDPVDPPHAAFETRFGALLFAVDHEMLHAGQIGLLRRLMGHPPLR